MLLDIIHEVYIFCTVAYIILTTGEAPHIWACRAHVEGAIDFRIVGIFSIYNTSIEDQDCFSMVM